jgi:hypothetical protein
MPLMHKTSTLKIQQLTHVYTNDTCAPRWATCRKTSAAICAPRPSTCSITCPS